MKKPVSAWIACVIALVITSIAGAAPFSVTYTDTISNVSGSVPGINLGQQTKAFIVFDNGGATTANQTWTSENVQCVIFTFNNAADKFVAVNYATGAPFTVTTGFFTTDGSGALQSGTFNWDDESDPITNSFTSNIAGVTSFDEWFLDAANNVVYLNLGNIGYTNVGNDTQVTNWSNPVSAAGVCASFLGTGTTTTAATVPTLSAWSVMILSIVMGASVLLGLRRRRR